VSKGQLTRQRMVDTATQLFDRQGYAATGLSQILKESGTPRGSFYYHFPDGKEALAEAVVQAHAEQFGANISAVLSAAPDPITGARMAVGLLAVQVAESGCTTGCPVTSIAFEQAVSSPRLQAATRTAIDGWVALVADFLVAHGTPDPQARATVLVGAVQGALVQCRAYGSRQPLDHLSTLVPVLLGS